MRKSHARSIFVAAVLVPVMFSLLVAGCAKRQNARPSSTANGRNASQVSGNAGGSPNGSQTGSTIKLSPTGGAQQKSGETTAPPRGGRSLQGTDRLLAMRSGTTIFPSDYDIGALQPTMPSGTEQGAILEKVHQFFAALEAGKLDEQVVAPRWRDELLRLMRPAIQDGNVPEVVRVGTLSVEQGAAHASIRLEKGKGSAEGRVYLERSDGAWYISDVQVDLAELAQPAVRSEPFDPAEWKAMIKE